MTEDELRAAAIEHASIPADTGLRINSPLMRLVPDGEVPSTELFNMAEAITGKPIERTTYGPLGATTVLPARVRSALTRWAVQQDGVHEMREHVRARELHRDLTGR